MSDEPDTALTTDSTSGKRPAQRLLAFVTRPLAPSPEPTAPPPVTAAMLLSAEAIRWGDAAQRIVEGRGAMDEVLQRADQLPPQYRPQKPRR